MKKVISVLLFLFFTVGIYSQDIVTILATVPTDVVFDLSAEDKEELVKTSTDGDTISVENAFGGDIKRLGFSSDYIALQTSDIGTVQIKLLPLINDSKIVCVINTVCGKACNSQVHFYNTNWQPLDSKGLIPLKDISWYIKPGVDVNSPEYKNAIIAVNMFPVKFSVNDKDLTLVAEYDKSYLSPEDYEDLKPFLSDQPKQFTWNKSSFN